MSRLRKICNNGSSNYPASYSLLLAILTIELLRISLIVGASLIQTRYLTYKGECPVREYTVENVFNGGICGKRYRF